MVDGSFMPKVGFDIIIDSEAITHAFSLLLLKRCISVIILAVKKTMMTREPPAKTGT